MLHRCASVVGVDAQTPKCSASSCPRLQCSLARASMEALAHPRATHQGPLYVWQTFAVSSAVVWISHWSCFFLRGGGSCLIRVLTTLADPAVDWQSHAPMQLRGTETLGGTCRNASAVIVRRCGSAGGLRGPREAAYDGVLRCCGNARTHGLGDPPA